MVDLALLQSVSYIAGALGVCVAASYYVMNLRETTRNRKVALTTSLMQNFISEEGSRRWAELMQMEWKDYDDYLKKYDWSVNPVNYAKRNTVWNTCDILGYQYMSGQIDLGTVWSICNTAVPMTWVKFGPVIQESKKRGETTKHIWEYFEYLAYVMSKAMVEMDSEFKMPAVFRSEEFYSEFKRSKHPFAST
jgi:hypothetical protein